MKLHITDFWHPTSEGTSDTEPISKLQNALYAAILVLGVPLVVAATVFAVHHLYDGMLWLIPS